MNNKEAVKYIEENIPPSKEKEIIITFIANSQRGIVRGYME
jgi:hypothetical protein